MWMHLNILSSSLKSLFENINFKTLVEGTEENVL